MIMSSARTSRTGRTGAAVHAASLFHEPFVLFGYLAGLTTRLEFVPGVIILPQRQTVLVAKQAAEVDVLTGGQFRLGIGVGWNEVEYEALNEEFRNRGKRSEEQIAVLRALFTDEVVTFHGKWHHIEAAGLNPMPVQRPIPIWIGGSSEATLKRVGEMATAGSRRCPPDETAREMVEQDARIRARRRARSVRNRLRGARQHRGRERRTSGHGRSKGGAQSARRT